MKLCNLLTIVVIEIANGKLKMLSNKRLFSVKKGCDKDNSDKLLLGLDFA